MGGGPAAFRDGRVVPKLNYDDRVVRDQQYKLWINSDRTPTKLYDLTADPWEEQNLIDSGDPQIAAALKRLTAVASQFPDRDAAPIYDPNPRQAWED